MKILRAGLNDIDIFTKSELDFGACCFYSEDRAFRYFFRIKGREATLYANTCQYIHQAIKEFLFYSGFIATVKSENGSILETKAQSEPKLCQIAKIQPSQFYISEKKLEGCKKWITGADDIFIPIVEKDGAIISLDGHTRMRAALDLGYSFVYVYPDEFDEVIFHFVDEAIKRKINSVCDMQLVSHEEYEHKWDKFCDDLLS